MGRGMSRAAAGFRPAAPDLQRAQPGRLPPAAASAVATAVRLREVGQLSDSILHLERAAQLDPGNAKIHLDLGVTFLASGRIEDAIPPLFRATEIDPKLPRAHYHLGLALERVGREAEAMVAFERALALRPRDADALRRLGMLYHDWRSVEKAAATYRAAAACAGTRVDALRFTARALRSEGDVAGAESALRRALALKPDDLELTELLASSLAEQGRFLEAEKLLRKLLERDATLSGSALALFDIVRATESDRPLLQRVARAMEGSEVPPQARMLAHFALGRAHDHLADYETAMRHYDAANAIRARVAPLNRAELQELADRLRAAFPTGEKRDQSEPADAAEERAVFILGLPRSGTTLVEQIISSHPKVAGGGELPFWPQRGPFILLSSPDDVAYASAASAYHAILAKISPDAARVTDKNPFNFFWIGAIHRALPGARIVHVRRSLIDTALSNYTTFLSSRRNFFMGNREDLLFWIDTYVDLMQHWRALVPRDRFLEIDYETLVADREAQTRRLVQFCRLDWDEACLYPERNERAVFTASVWQARQPVYRGSVERWRKYLPWLGPLARLVPPETAG
jgi:tetratricopeptide (TPR) repeat protein